MLAARQQWHPVDPTPCALKSTSCRHQSQLSWIDAKIARIARRHVPVLLGRTLDHQIPHSHVLNRIREIRLRTSNVGSERSNSSSTAKRGSPCRRLPSTGAHVVLRLSKITVQAFYDDWSRRQVWASGTRTAMDLAMRSSGLGGYQLDQVSHSHIEAWIKRMADQPLAAGTIKTRYNNVRGVFRAAVRDRLIARDPTEAVRLPRQRRVDASMTIPSIEAVGALVCPPRTTRSAFVAVCAFAGLRLGEAAAVQVADIDFLRRQLTVARQGAAGR